MDDAPLGDLLVLDFSRVLAAPLATMLLADHGATVLKVERPGRGDDTRGWGPPHAPDGTATYFLSVNRGKHSVALDLADEADLAAARELAEGADVVVQNFRPGVMERLGLDHDTLSAANPRLISCTVTGFGSGAGAAMPGYDLLLQAVGGLMSVTGAPDGEPQKVGVALVDVITGLFATTGILAALRHRDRTGQGQAVELNLLTCLLAALVNQSTAQTAAGVTPGPDGQRPPQHRALRDLRHRRRHRRDRRGHRPPVRAAVPGHRRARAGGRPALRHQHRAGREPGRAARGHRRAADVRLPPPSGGRSWWQPACPRAG